MSRVGLIAITLFLLVLAGCNLGTSPETTAPQIEVSPTVVASLTCNEMVTEALARANTFCASTGRNQACYGNSLVNAEMKPNTTAKFDKTGDIADLFSFDRLVTSPLNEQAQTWGVVILKAQANLPDTLPGQNVTFLLYGDAALEDISPEMRAVVLKTGVSGASSTTCAEAPKSALLLQSPEGSQATLTINGANISLGSTAYLTAEQNSEMEIATIEGSAVVSAFNTTRIVQPGAKVGIALGGTDGLQVAGPPSEPEPFDVQVISEAPVSLLERPVVVPSPIAPATSTPIRPTDTIAPPCTPRTDWAFTYIIQPGDNLSRIAQSFQLTLAELQQGNCILDPNQVQAGQVLRVPTQQITIPATITPTVLPTVAATPEPSNPNLRADSTLINAGECTTIRWDAANITQIFFEGQPTSGSSSQQVCPKSDTTYTLLVVQADGKRVPYAIRIQVVLPAEATEQLR